VGVFLGNAAFDDDIPCLPHMRGGVSKSERISIEAKKSSPHAWGCFLDVILKVSILIVFPTCVGVFLA